MHPLSIAAGHEARPYVILIMYMFYALSDDVVRREVNVCGLLQDD